MSIFERKITVDVDSEGECLLLKGRLHDTRLDADLHIIEVDMKVKVWDGEIREISGRFPTWPMEECKESLQVLDELVGLKIRPGFSEQVKTIVGSRRGCSHLAALIMNMGNTSIQGRGGYLRKFMPDDEARTRIMAENAKELNLIDSCVAWGEDGPILRRWRNELKDKPPY